MIGLDKITAIKEAANIVDVIEDFVKLKKRGSVYIGLSPFNNERTPSFTINPAKDIYKDFSSGKGGDVINFLMEVNKWGYIEAVKYLAKKYNVDIENNDFVYILKVHKKKQEVKPTDFIHPEELLKTTTNINTDNNLYKFLCSKLSQNQVDQKFIDYHIGTDHTNGYTKDFTVFWQVDKDYMVRSGKYIKYLETGRRDKSVNISWFHSRMIEYKPVYPDFNLVQCFFGEHLINDDIRKPIAIVESEKTAIIASVLMKSYIWLSCGSKYGLNDLKCAVLKNRSVTLFPDLGAYDKWKVIAQKNSYSINQSIEKIANEQDKQNGFDIADFLLR